VAVAVAGCAALAVVGFVTVQPAAAGSAHNGRAHAIYRVATGQRMVAMTFDDGPDPRWTPQVLRLLADHGAHATFFQIGDNALANRDLVADVLAGGHEIGNHTLDHAHLPTLSTEQIRREVMAGTDALVAAGAPPPTYFRPPIGLTDGRVEAITEGQGLRTAFWSLCVEKYVNHTDVAAGTATLLGKVKPGAIILAHDGGIPDRTRTMESLPQLLDALTQQGYRIVSLGELEAAGIHPAPATR
jgi:peptidoglycan/xylan/chitin deacetylase (PgdA/CDA1 family)